MKDFLNKAGKTAKEVAGKAGEKAGDLIETGKVKTKVYSLKSSKEELYQKIGEYYYNQYEEGDAVDGIVGGWCREIQTINEEIRNLEDSLN